LFLVRGDGQFAALTVFRAESVAAWTLHNTMGSVKSVAVVGDEVYMLVQRGSEYFIEQLDDTLNLDSALTGEIGSPATLWSGLDHLEGRSASILADGFVLPSQTVTGGQITLAESASQIEVGLPYTHIVQPLPPSEIGSAGGGRRVRMIEGLFRLQDTQSLRLDVGRGLTDIALRQLGEDLILDAPPPSVSGDVKVRALGWQSEATKPLWRIEQDDPLAFTLLSVTTQLKVND
jgi:hypothetical protein